MYIDLLEVFFPYYFSSLEVVEELGEGVLEHVFKARVPGLVTPVSACEEFVAVKTLKSNVETDLLEDFVKEVQTCLQFDHKFDKYIIRLVVSVCFKL